MNNIRPDSPRYPIQNHEIIYNSSLDTIPEETIAAQENQDQTPPTPGVNMVNF